MREMMVPLVSFHPPSEACEVQVRLLAESSQQWQVSYRVQASNSFLRSLALPSVSSTVRKQDLWKQNCFELFWKNPEGASYFEWNISPLGEWNLYEFSSYRKGMREVTAAQTPQVSSFLSQNGFELKVTLPQAFPSKAVHVRPAVILYPKGGEALFFSNAHASERPDFHDWKVPAVKWSAKS